jgi:hypothetical protein
MEDCPSALALSMHPASVPSRVWLLLSGPLRVPSSLPLVPPVSPVHLVHRHGTAAPLHQALSLNQPLSPSSPPPQLQGICGNGEGKDGRGGMKAEGG